MTPREYRFISKDGKRHTPWKPCNIHLDDEDKQFLPSRETSTWLGEKFNLQIRDQLGTGSESATGPAQCATPSPAREQSDGDLSIDGVSEDEKNG